MICDLRAFRLNLNFCLSFNYVIDAQQNTISFSFVEDGFMPVSATQETAIPRGRGRPCFSKTVRPHRRRGNRCV